MEQLKPINLKITVVSLKFRPIIDQTGTFTYNATKVISDYLKTLCKNEYIHLVTDDGLYDRKALLLLLLFC